VIGGGLVCPGCRRDSDKRGLFAISDEVIKILRFAAGAGWSEIAKLRLSTKLSGELSQAVSNILRLAG